MNRWATEVKTLLAQLQSENVCAHCGKQPIEWHNPSHAQGREDFRIARLARSPTMNSVDRIKAEVRLCTPLCRRCHMIEDGRLDQLLLMTRKYSDDEACASCGRVYKPLRRNLCESCYDHGRVRVRPPLHSPAGPKTWTRQPKPCTAAGCTAPFYARGYCKRHYGQWRFHGKVVRA